MLSGIDAETISRRLLADNPWWEDPGIDPAPDLPRTREYFPALFALTRQRRVRRSVILMGSRRVGKTVMLLQLVRRLIQDGFPAGRIFYVSLASPVYSGQPLERLLHLYRQERRCGARDRSVVIFDEIQYLKDWEIHLKALTDSYPACRFVAAGSAGAALKRKSVESGAGRFTDLLLPPLAFAEYLSLRGLENEVVQSDASCGSGYRVLDMDGLNRHFVDYLNFGGYPESALDAGVRRHAGRFLLRDVVDRVLLHDLPSLYGIQDVQELNRLLAYVAYRSGQAISPKKLAEHSAVAPDTVRRYLQYLAAAFLTVPVSRVDDAGKTFRRTRNFKVYLANPSLRAALYGSLGRDDEDVERQAETAVISQRAHLPQFRNFRYARWGSAKSREVDLVRVRPETRRADWACEIKWSDGHVDEPRKTVGLLEFAQRNRLPEVCATTRARFGRKRVGKVWVEYVPTALHCYAIGRDEIRSLSSELAPLAFEGQ